jgi:D-alanyl-D-alanine carboxypeptidase (penicillin-binding protein 5/6)
MYGPILSVLLFGVVPVWGLKPPTEATWLLPTVAQPIEESQGADAIDRAVGASGAVVLDLDSGQTMFARSVAAPRPMASLTKLMTALIIAENHAMDEKVVVPRAAADVGGNEAHLPHGETFTVGDLLSATLVTSANDAATTLALYHAGSQDAFVEAMNIRARELGLQHTAYANPTGLDAPGQQSSPQDLAWLTMFVLRNPEISKRMGVRGTSITSAEGTKLYLTHTHALLHADTGVVAGKTGTTDGAGQCLLSIVRVGARRLLVVLLHSADRYRDMRTMLDILNPSPTT